MIGRVTVDIGQHDVFLSELVLVFAPFLACLHGLVPYIQGNLWCWLLACMTSAGLGSGSSTLTAHQTL